MSYFLFKECSLGGILQTNSDVTIDMSRRQQGGLGFARIAKLVTSKNVNIPKKEEPVTNGKDVTPIAVKEVESKKE